MTARPLLPGVHLPVPVTFFPGPDAWRQATPTRELGEAPGKQGPLRTGPHGPGTDHGFSQRAPALSSAPDPWANPVALP